MKNIFTKKLYLRTLIMGIFFIFFSCNKDMISSSTNTPTSSSCIKTIEPINISCTNSHLNTSFSGFRTNYNLDSTIILSEGNYEKGKQQGFWKFNHPDGKPFKEGNFTHNKINGFWKLYYKSGNLREEGNYDNCIRSGYWKFFFDDNLETVKSEGNYMKGIKSGHWKFYSEDGTISEEKDC